ncbi:MAG TPA: flagellar biosynthesis protein FlhB [Firmicutes bacterium]|nr:flagellar biosynthesis protein FlhB [Bacillota bacterium]
MPRDDRTEAATPRRRQEARRRGQVARSLEINTAFILLVATAAIGSWSWYALQALQKFLIAVLSHCHEFHPSWEEMMVLAREASIACFKVAGPIIVACLIAGLIASGAQVGFLLTLEPLIPRLSRLDPIAGLSRLFSARAGIELAKSMIKVTIVGYVGFISLRQEWERIALAVQMDNFSLVAATRQILLTLGYRMGTALALLAAADYIIQRREFEANLRMTKQEVKEEFRQMEGDPVVRSRIRSKQRQVAMQRMMQEVPRATVVVTNPVHVAVALKYDSRTMKAPRVVAKGARLLCERIKEIARNNGVPVVENPPLAQALYKSVDIGREIPVHLYKAVAEVLAYVFYLNKLKGVLAGGGREDEHPGSRRDLAAHKT